MTTPAERGIQERAEELAATNGHAARDPLEEPARCSDRGNSLRFAHDWRQEVRYVAPWNTWLTWDGQRFAPDERRTEAMRRAKATVGGIFAETGYAESDTERRELARHALRSESEPALRRMLALAQSEPGIALLPGDFDRDPFVLNTPSGLVELKAAGATLRPARLEDLVSKITAAPYVPGARHPVFDRYVARVLPDPDVRAFLQRVAGYALTGSTVEEKVFFVYGPTAGGKSTLLKALRMALGDYAAVADFASFTERRREGPREDFARLAGARLVVSIEVGDGTRLAESVVKWLSGGDVIAARRLYERTFEFQPQFKIVIAGNHRPRARDDDDALWRRLLEVPFRESLPEAERDPAVKATLCDPATGGVAVLAWAVEGAIAWRRDGLRVPAAVLDATAAYRGQMDPLRDFLADCCVLEPEAAVTAKELRESYECWSRENGIRAPLSGRAFGDRLKARDCEPSRRDHGRERVWRGVRLRGLLDGEPEGDRVTEGDATTGNSLYARAYEESYGNDVTRRHPSPEEEPW